jgi:AhpC/TSA family
MTTAPALLSPKSNRPWRRILIWGLALVAVATALGYFALPYISVIGAPVAKLETGDLADASFKSSDGQTHKLSDYRGKITVLEWTSPICEFTIRHYDSGGMRAEQDYGASKNVNWIPITTATPQSEGYRDAAGLQALLTARKTASPYMIMDEDGKLGRMFGAHATPSAAVIDATGKLAYIGAFDNQPWGDGKTGTKYVRAAIDELAAGNSVTVPFTRAYGCSIKYP